MSRIDQQPYVKNYHLTIFCAIDMYMFLISLFSIYITLFTMPVLRIYRQFLCNNNKRNQQILYANFAKNMLSFITDQVFNKNVGIVTVPFIHKFPPSQYLSNNDTEKHNPISHTHSHKHKAFQPLQDRQILSTIINIGTKKKSQLKSTKYSKMRSMAEQTSPFSQPETTKSVSASRCDSMQRKKSICKSATNPRFQNKQQQKTSL